MTRTIFIVSALAFAATLPTISAQATGAPRTFVSAAGSDINNCTNVATPCRHLAAAFAATAADGEIYVLDPANYGSLSITHGVSIEGHGWASIAPVINGNAITISANPGDKINIVGVVLDGTALAGTVGVLFNSGSSLTVRDSVIRNFSAAGIIFAPNTSGLSQLYVSNTIISDNIGNAIDIGTLGSGTTNSVLNHVEMENNGNVGLFVDTSTQTIAVTVSDSVIANNVSNGILAQSDGGTQVKMMLRNSTIANNGLNGLVAQNTGATVRVTRSTITGNNSAGWVNGTGGVVLSYGDNNIDDNGSANTEPPNPLTYN